MDATNQLLTTTKLNLEDIEESLRTGDTDNARYLADKQREWMVDFSPQERELMLATSEAWITAHANGHGPTMREMLGMAHISREAGSNNIRENIIVELLTEAGEMRDSNPTRYDELISAAIESVVKLNNRVAEFRLRRDFSRLAGLTASDYDSMLKNARATGEASANKTADGAITLRPTDDELRDRWIAKHTNVAYGLGEFREYANGVWSPLNRMTVEGQVLAVLESAKGEKVRPTASLLASVMKLAQVRVGVPDEKWDASADVLICRNGALHIPSRELKPHSPMHFSTLAVEYDYDPNATAPMWQHLLETTVPNEAGFLQEFAGLCLTPNTSHEIAVWLYGPRGSGRSTFITGLQAMLGARAGLLGLADVERSQFALTNLPGKTLMVSTEQPSDFIRASHVLNALISGEPITVERKYQDPFVIVPRVKLCWAMNELPRVADAGNGLFRRVKVVKFPPLADSVRNPQVKEKIKLEGAGILNWALEGLARLQARGRFQIPDSIETATEEFKTSNDITANFIADECELGPDFRAQSGDLYSRYQSWCERNGHRAKSATAMASEWERLGFERYRANGKTFWRGVELGL